MSSPKKAGETADGGKNRTTVLVSLPRDEMLLQGVLEQTRELRWDIIDIHCWGGAIPSHIKPDGAILDCLPTAAMARQFLERQCPVVRLGRHPHQLDHKVPAVLIDLAEVGRVAAEHFAERKFRHLGFVGHDPWSGAQSLYQGFRKRALELDCQCHLLRLNTPESDQTESTTELYERWATLIGEWLGKLAKPIGVLGYNDRMAGTIVAMCQAAGLAVPEDVAVLGQGNDRFRCESAPVSLSSIALNREKMGREAVLLLNRLLNREPVPTEPLTVPPKGVVVRHSSAMLAVGNPLVSKAMRFLWDHLDVDMSVADVAEEFHVSRRKLERAFRKHLNRGVNEELRRKRLERCCELLRSTDLTIAEIAPRVGFRSKDYLHQAFRKTFGTSPRQYRRR